LNLGFNNVAGTLPTELALLDQLQYLFLQNNDIEGGLEPTLADITTLQIIYLMNNHITGRIPGRWATFQAITTIFLDNNLISGEIPTILAESSTLTAFQASNNSLTGVLPTEFGNLTGLVTLYLDSNYLTGTLPTEMKNCTSLKFLRLNNNGFEGQIPEEWAYLRALAEADLSDNQLGCFFPDFLEGGNFIWNVTGNQFYCPIPSDVTGVDCAKTTFTSVTPSDAILSSLEQDVTPIITIEGTGIQPLCSVVVNFGSIPTIPLSQTNSSVVVQIPYQAPGTVTISMGLPAKKVSGATLPFVVRAACTGSGPVGCGNGTCDTLKGICTCPPLTFGATCDSACPKDCTGHGKCFLVGIVPACKCNPGFLGVDCETTLCPSTTCNGNGICDLASGKCVCDPGWTGDECNRRPPCPNCGHGDCYFLPSVVDALCDCDNGWYGEVCNQQAQVKIPWLGIGLGIGGCVLVIIIAVGVFIFCRFKKPSDNEEKASGL